ncbi:Ppx/GppA family phosphatase [Paenibacillus sp. MBLB4367]|uniref:Ppx/GppA phosphatase family protein n=1 Tax=Paenibacillus sp. MBLB4367 TaxID=3384767 RepID=UPI00390804C2
MKAERKFGIIDIGSNSIRLVIYEETDRKAHRVVDESKEAARLSEKIGSDGVLPEKEMQSIVDTLNHFKKLCQSHRTSKIRAVATAAIRNAKNSAAIVNYLERHTNLHIEVLSGEEEARLGFLGTMNALDVREGFLVDIGGGSTEVTLFRDRRIVNSVSFPFGSVNTTKRFSDNGHLQQQDIERIQSLVKAALDCEPWIRSAEPGLPLIGLGGTIRSAAKLVLRQSKHSLPLAHNYELDGATIERLTGELAAMSVEQRKKVDGLSKDRADIIVPGLLILQTVYAYTRCSHYVISGSGLRDGIFYETAFSKQPMFDNVLEHSVNNLLNLHPAVPLPHVVQVNKLALALFDGLQELHGLEQRCRTYVHVASLLYRIGVTVNYYNYEKHTFYLMAHSRIDGLSHREIILCALIASYRTRNRTRQASMQHRDLLSEADSQLAIRLGALVQLATALDRSQSQPISAMQTELDKRTLKLRLSCAHSPSVELRQIESLERDFRKIWGIGLTHEETVLSTT